MCPITPGFRIATGDAASRASRRSVASGFARGRDVTVKAKKADGSVREFKATVRIDTPQEVQYYQHGGILQYVLRQLLATK